MINTGGKRMQKNKNVTSEVIITSVHYKYTPNIYTISRFIKKLLLKRLLPNFGKSNLNNCCITFVCLK